MFYMFLHEADSNMRLNWLILFIDISFLKRITGKESNEADALENQEIGRDYMVCIHKKEVLTMNIFSKIVP